MKISDKKETQVTLGLVGEIELPSFDAKPFIGKKVKIAQVTEHQGNFGYYIKVESEVVAVFGDNEIRASKIFGLHEDKTGKIGWGKETKLGLYLERMKVKHYNELVGKQVILITRINKDGMEFLDFN